MNARHMRRITLLIQFLLHAALIDVQHASAQTIWARLPEFETPNVAAGGISFYTVADMNGDGVLDILRPAAYPGFGVRIGKGNGLFEPERFNLVTSLSPIFHHRAIPMDVDSDGDLDVLVVGMLSVNPTSAHLFINQGNGSFVYDNGARLPRVLGYSTDAACVDVDHDGRPDLLITQYPGQPRLYMNRGNVFVDESATRIPGGAYYTGTLVAKDVNGDGFVDFVLANGVSLSIQERNVLLLNDGTGHFYDAGAFHDSIGYNVDVVVEDLDGDGLPDVVFGLWETRRLLYRNLGNGTFVNESWRMPPVVPNAIYPMLAAGDIDGDGDIDILNGWYDGIDVYRNDGLGNFTFDPLASFGRPLLAASMVLADFDRDGDPDLLASISGTSTGLSVTLLNLKRQAIALSPPQVGTPWGVFLSADPSHVMLPYLGLETPAISIPPYGFWSLGLTTLVPLGALVIPASGFQQLTLPVPNDARLRGQAFRLQALDYDPQTPARTHFTSFLHATVK